MSAYATAHVHASAQAESEGADVTGMERTLVLTQAPTLVFTFVISSVCAFFPHQFFFFF